MTKTPKSSFELTMERLNAADRDAGVSDTPLTGKQKAAIAEVRAMAGARLAEREILFRDGLKRAHDPELRAKLEEEYRIDRSRIESDRDKAIEAVRSGR
jgi:hypothetical protein